MVEDKPRRDEDEWRFPRRRILLDFDGTLGPMVFPKPLGKPYLGVVDAIRRLREAGFEVIIFSSRLWPGWKAIDGEAFWQAKIDEMTDWLTEHEIVVDGFTHEKIPAMWIVDDRAVNPNQFTDGFAGLVEFVMRQDKTNEYGKSGRHGPNE